MKEHDQQLTLNLPKAPPVPRIAPKIDNKTMEALQRQAELERLARRTPPTPQAPPPSAGRSAQHRAAGPAAADSAAQRTQARAAVRRAALRSASPTSPRTSQSAHDAMQNAMRGALSGRSGADIPAPGSAGPLQAGAQILSDTQGVDFCAYMRRLHDDIQRNWDPLIPEEVQPPLLQEEASSASSSPSCPTARSARQ